MLHKGCRKRCPLTFEKMKIIAFIGGILCGLVAFVLLIFLAAGFAVLFSEDKPRRNGSDSKKQQEDY